MAVSNRIFLLLVISNFIFFWSSVLANPLKFSARVLVIQDRSVEDGYKVKIESNGVKRELQLTPLESVWSDDAHALHIKRNEEGEKILERVDIPKDLKIYHDQKKGSFLSIKEGKVNGILDSDYIIKSEGEEHFIRKSVFNKKNLNVIDYKEIDNKLHKNIRSTENSFYSREISSYTPEVAVIVDSELSNLLGSDTAIYLYLTIFWNAVNKRFETIDDPQINIRLVGCVIIRNPQDEPFLTDNKDEEGNIDSNEALYDGGDWIYQNLATLPEHDFMYIQIGAGLGDVAGRAFLGAVCWIGLYGYTTSFAVGIGEDRYGYFSGVDTAVHELAHNLGSPHDPKTGDETNECDWEKGYIMSYGYGSFNNLFFSPCSIQSMADHLETSRASCTTQNLSQTKPSGVFTSNQLPGDVLTMDQQCQKITGHDNAKVYTKVSSESELCYNMKCIAYLSSNSYSIWTTNRGAAEGSRCPSGKHCYDGQCI